MDGLRRATFKIRNLLRYFCVMILVVIMHQRSARENRRRVATIAIDAFYDNFTCAALFGKLRVPGSPQEVFDPRPAREFWHSERHKVRVEWFSSIADALGHTGTEVGETVKSQATKGEYLESFLVDRSPYTRP